MKPFAGSVFMVRPQATKSQDSVLRDSNGCSIPVRMAMYVSSLIPEKSFSLLPQDQQVQILYYFIITTELLSDQIDLLEDNKLFSSRDNPQTLLEIREFLLTVPACLLAFIQSARTWLDNSPNASLTYDSSAVVRDLISKFLSDSLLSTPVAFYAAKGMGHLLQKLVDAHGWPNVLGEEWLSNIGIMKSPYPNTLGATAVLTGLQGSLDTSKHVNNMCNRLISDIAGASAKSEKTLGLLVTLNATLSVYDEGDLPVPQNRLVFAVKQILSWFEADFNIQLLSESFHALQTLLPAIKDVYGSYWEKALDLCLLTWNKPRSEISEEEIPVIGMSLKLFKILSNLSEANDDLVDSLTTLGAELSQGLILLLQTPRLKESRPLQFVDDLLSRLVVNIPLNHIKDMPDLYPLIASDYWTIQSAAYDVLHKALPEAQKQLSVDVLLEKTGVKKHLHLS
jgi:hypothetical protein